MQSKIVIAAENILEFLGRHPHVVVESSDDNKCKELFLALGILELFTRADSPNISVGTYPAHPTHWIVGMCWSGYPRPEENGYKVCCLPKSIIPEKGARDFVDYTLEQYGGSEREDTVRVQPSDWRERH